MERLDGPLYCKQHPCVIVRAQGLSIQIEAYMKFRVGACALLVCLAGCSGKGPNTDFAELRGAAATKSAAGQLPKLQLGRAAAKSIASAPDHGALVTYQNKGAPTKREGAFTYYPVAISEAHALKALVTGEMTVPSPDGSQVKLRYERHEEHPDGNWTWIGRVVGGNPLQEAIITFGEKAVFASIPQANGKSFGIETRNDALFAVQVDRSKVKPGTTGHVDMLVPEASAIRDAAAKVRAAAQPQMQAQVAQAAVAQGAPATSANTVDVAIGYTQAMRERIGSQSGVVTRLLGLVSVANTGLANSNINGYLRLVTTVEVAYTESNTNQAALRELTGSTGTTPVTVPASLVPLRTARDASGADIALLVRNFQQPEQEGCGIAWLIGANRSEIVPSTDSGWAYAVISDGWDENYFCAEETLAHESAHLMGSAHDAANSKNENGSQLYGRYDYSFGYKSGSFFTIMAYGDDASQTSVRMFSNPNITTCGTGTSACGVANQADNARSLNQTIPLVAAFRATVVPIAPSTLLGTIEGMGGKCLDVRGASTAYGALIQTWACSGLGQQQWSLKDVTAALSNTAANKVLDVAGFGTANGSRLQLWEGTGATNQAWIFTNSTILSNAGRALDAAGNSSANGTRIQLWETTGAANQVWMLDPTSGRLTGKDGKCLDVAGFGTSNGTPVQLWACTGTANQKWRLGSGGTLIGYGGKCLEAANQATGNGTEIRMWDCNGGAHQRWRIRGEIRSAASNKCLDDPASGRDNGSLVHVWDCHGGDNQRWEFYSN
jgi:peptidyl-Asp metalloendopeptidase